MQYDFQRYLCQMALPDFSTKAQRLLQNASALIVGMGGLGCPAAQYLVSSGIGTVGLADHDLVSISNLNRQILYSPEDIGILKITAAARRLSRQNPETHLVQYPFRLTSENVLEIVKKYDIIIDGTDNFETRYLLNDACVIARKPYIYGAIYQYEGQMAILNTPNPNGTRSPNFRDLFPNAELALIPNCTEGGLIPPLAGIVGCMQANEAIKFLTHSKEVLACKMWLFNTQTGQSHIIKIGKLSHATITNLRQTIHIPLITKQYLEPRIEKNIYELIDVRSQQEHQVFNIGGKNIPLTTLKKQKTLHFTKPVVCYCQSGKKSAEAVIMLKERFPSHEFFSLDGGLNAWM